MKRLTITILVPLLLLIYWNCGSTHELESTQNFITPSLIQEHLSVLASDKMEGRNTPSAGLDSAARYIGREFESYGLKKVNGSYFQQVNLGFVTLGDENWFRITKNGKEISFDIKDDFIPFEITGNNTSEGEIVFCGYGIDAPEYGYNDYKNIDVKGKIVLLLKHEPGENDSTSVFNKTKLTDYSELTYKCKTAADKGAVAVIVLNDPLNHMSVKPIGFPWPSLSKIIPKDALPLLLLKNEYSNIPVIQAGEKLITELFGSVDELKALQKKIDAEMKGYSKDFGITGSVKTTILVNKTPADNVVGLLEGSDPVLKDEILVIGAHYDHVGFKKNAAAGEDNIFNGADDNASGTSGVLAIAKAFSSMEVRPKRSILFITFCGEEKGLYGSKFYVDNPLFPLKNTVAMLNMDMIGRNSADSVYIIGHSRCPELKAINDEENNTVGFELIQRPEGSGRMGGSDHASFLRKGIPALFYFSGIHDDYHQVSDSADLINYDKAARIAQLVFRTAYRISNDSSRYKVTEKLISLF